MKTKVIRLEDLYSLMANDAACDCLLTTNHIHRFSRKIHYSDIGVILDWDDTLTMPGIHNNSWQITNRAFSKVGTTKDNLLLEKIAKQYHEIEKQRPLTSAEMKKWQRTNLEMYVNRGLRLDCVEKEIGRSSMDTYGAILLIYLLKNCSKVCIASSGVKNVIERTLERSGIDHRKYGNLQINATELVFNKKGTIEGWDDQSIVTAKNKPWITSSFSKIWDISHENIFAIGDGNTDFNALDLVSKDATMIFFCPSHRRETLTKEKMELISQKAHGFVKEDFGIITNFFIKTMEA